MGFENNSNAREFKRPIKRLRSAEPKNNNLAVFGQLRSNEKIRALAATSDVARHAQKEDATTRHLRELEEWARENTGEKADTNADPVTVRDAVSSGGKGQRYKVAALTLATIVVGAVVGIIWAPSGQLEHQNGTGDSQTLSSLATQDTSGEKISQVREITALPISPPTAQDLYFIKFELDVSSELNREYAEELAYLRAVNTSLRNEVTSLGDETIDLNNDLLQLESAMSSSESTAEKPVEIRTVYDIVNVPLGSGPENVSIEPPDNAIFNRESGSDN